MIDHLTFQCPHCKEPVDVPEDALGGNFDCPHCDRMFQATAPAGKLMEVRDGSKPVVATHEEEEEVLREVHPVLFRQHLVLTVVCFLLLVGALAGLVLFLMGNALLGLSGGGLLIASAIAGLIALSMLAKWWLHVLGTTLTVTNTRTILRTGILSKNTSEVQHDDVRNIKSDRNTFERLFNYGDIAISSSGQDDFEIVAHDIPDPDEILAIIRRHQR